MGTWSLAPTQQRLASELGLGRERTLGPDRPDVPVLRYEGPYGPADVAYFDGLRRTRVWGPAIPEGVLDDGPELLHEPQAKQERLRRGVAGSIGGTPLRVHQPRNGWRRSARVVTATIGPDAFALRVRGILPKGVALERAAGGEVARYAVRTGGRRTVDDTVSSGEVTLLLLLLSTADVLAPRM